MPRFSVDSCTYYGSHFPLKFSHLVFYEIFTRENSPHPKSIFLETQQRVHLSLKFPTTNFIAQGKPGWIALALGKTQFFQHNYETGNWQEKLRWNWKCASLIPFSYEK